jgi:hypothetical protein
MDGRQSVIAYLLVLWTHLRYFATEYHEELRKFLLMERGVKGFNKSGQTYRTRWQNQSGKPHTCCENSLENAFDEYHVRRLSGQSPIEAFKALGLHGGDDSLREGALSNGIAEFNSEIGYVYKPNLRLKGSFADFLGRVYLDPWSGPENIARVKLALGKLHLSHTDPKVVPVEVQRQRKADAIRITDPNTPFLSTWAAHFYTGAIDLDNEYVSYTIRHTSPECWTLVCPNKDDERIWAVTAEIMGMSVSECQDLDQRIKTLDYRTGPLLDTPPEVAVSAVIAGEPVHPETIDETLSKQELVESQILAADLSPEPALPLDAPTFTGTSLREAEENSLLSFNYGTDERPSYALINIVGSSFEGTFMFDFAKPPYSNTQWVMDLTNGTLSIPVEPMDEYLEILVDVLFAYPNPHSACWDEDYRTRARSISSKKNAATSKSEAVPKDLAAPKEREAKTDQ